MSDKQSTFIILSPGFPKSEQDTTCLPAQQLFVQKLKENFPSFEIIVVSFQYPFHHTPYRWHGVDVIPLNGQNRRKFGRLLTWLRAVKALKKIQRSKNVVGILSFWCTETALIGKWFGKMYGIQHRCWILGQDARAGNRFVKWIRPSANKLIALSDFLADEFFKNYSVKPANVIPNGVDINLFTKCTEKPIDILGVGSLIPLKQYEVFIRLIQQIKKTHPSIRAVICGEGIERNKLASLVNSLALNENVHLAGETDHKEVIQLMHQAKVFLHPSSYEGFSGACLEALHAGAEVISFCKSMKEDIPRWHIVKTEEEMLAQVLSRLQKADECQTPPVSFPMEESVKRILALYNHKA